MNRVSLSRDNSNILSALLNICSNDELKPALNYPFFKDGKIIVTDAHILIFVNVPEGVPKLKGLFKFERISGTYDWIYSEVNEKFPDVSKYELDFNSISVDKVSINYQLINKVANCISKYSNSFANITIRFGKNMMIIEPYEECPIKAIIMQLKPKD